MEGKLGERLIHGDVPNFLETAGVVKTSIFTDKAGNETWECKDGTACCSSLKDKNREQAEPCCSGLANVNCVEGLADGTRATMGRCSALTSAAWSEVESLCCTANRQKRHNAPFILYPSILNKYSHSLVLKIRCAQADGRVEGATPKRPVGGLVSFEWMLQAMLDDSAQIRPIFGKEDNDVIFWKQWRKAQIK